LGLDAWSFRELKYGLDRFVMAKLAIRGISDGTSIGLPRTLFDESDEEVTESANMSEDM
jgi:hypothetical protein